MTAFAAVLSRSSATLDPFALSRVASALVRPGRTTPRPLVLDDRCALISSPLHGADDPAPLVLDAPEIALTGQVLLEQGHGIDAGDHRRSPLAIVAAAYAKWGGRAMEHLAGEYAFALWDRRNRVLLTARDGLGIRILYVAEGTGIVVVTNTLAAALAHPAVSDALDDASLVRFLADGETAPGATAYRSVRTVPAGHTLLIPGSLERTTLDRHWSFPRRRGSQRQDRQALLDGYRAALEAAVADRMPPGPVSVLLSGGMDSTTIAAAACARGRAGDVRAFTATYRAVASPDAALAERVGTHLGFVVAPVPSDRYEPLYPLWEDAPTPQPVDEPTLTDWRGLVSAAATHSTVTLYGEDGDAVFAPPGWQALRRESGIAALAGAVCRSLLERQERPYLGLRFRERLGLARRPPIATAPSWLGEDARRTIGPRDAVAPFDHTPVPLPPHPTRPEMQSRLHPGVSRYLATIASRELTGQDTELRFPLLDSRVLQFVVDVPAIPWCQRKRLAREAYRNRLPLDVIERPKSGVGGLFEGHVRWWQRERLPAIDRRSLTSPVRDWIDREAWRTALGSRDAREVGIAWRVLALDAWLTRRYEANAVEARACTR